MVVDSRQRWALAIRALIVLSVILLLTTCLEGVAIRRARAELERLRSDQNRSRAALTATWTRESVGEVDQAVLALDGVFSDPDEGLGRAGGLCADGRINDAAIASLVFGTYLADRAAGRSHEGAIEMMTSKAQATKSNSR